MIKLKLKKLIVFCIACAITVSSLGSNTLADSAVQNKSISAPKSISGYKGTTSQTLDDYLVDKQMDRNARYTNYLSKYQNAPKPQMDIAIDASDYSSVEQGSAVKKIGSYEGQKGVVSVSEESGWVEYQFNVAEEGLYNLSMLYYPLISKNRQIEIAVELNGDIPYNEAASLYLPRFYKNETNQIQQDQNGNQYTPRQVEVTTWINNQLRDPNNEYDDPLQFYLKKGQNTIRIYMLQEPFLLKSIKFDAIEKPCTYSSYLLQHGSSINGGNNLIKIEAELADLKNDQSLSPESDRTDPLDSPYSASKVKINVIGDTWESPGQWLEWNVNIPKNGYYQLSFRYRQDYIKGFFVSRRLYIDGKVPFEEANSFQFPYSESWDMLTLKKGVTPYYFYLTKGVHQIRLEDVLGQYDETVRSLNDVVFNLNDLYRKIIMITGTQPDQYRDYNLDTVIPGLTSTLKSSSKLLEEKLAYIKKITGTNGVDAEIMDTLARQMDSMASNPQTIPQRIDDFKNNIESLSGWALDMRDQPLALDYLCVSEKDAKLPRAKSNFFDLAKKEGEQFFYSFITDYDSFGSSGKQKTITMWMGTGRDQAEIVRRMVNDLFTPQYNINVNIKLVSATMVEAFLSGQTPDVAIMVARGQPVNLAIRGALLDLSGFGDFKDITQEFQPTAFVPYEFQNGVYGIPDMQIFYMMFYRRDIFKELNLSPPKTWTDFYKLLPILQLHNMDVGVPYTTVDASGSVDSGMGARNLFPALLLQNGGSFYNSELSKTELSSQPAIQAFTQWTDFYSKYGLPLSYDFFNRFRTGEMPLAIASYTMYGQLVQAAPEIRNLWDMVPIPGTRKSDGSIDISQAGSGSAAVILSNTKNPQESWQFIKWWIGAQAQSRYASDIEAQLGIVARQAVANKQAFDTLSWSSHEYQNLQEQWSNVREIPEVPGGYYVSRGLDNAFRDVVYKSKNATQSITEYSKQIDDEIVRKRSEFGLD